MEEQKKEFVHSLKQIAQFKLMSPLVLIGVVLIILSGVATGYVLSRNQNAIPLTTEIIDSSKVKKGQIFGSEDTKTFRDIAEGTLEQGGVRGEGSHKLIRPGGESQTAALTSSIVNLDQLLGRKVKVWGETAKKDHSQ